jgi:hypothetical protein
MIVDIILGSTLVGLACLVYAGWSVWRVRRARSPYSGACPCGCTDAAILPQELAANTQGHVKNILETSTETPAKEQVTGEHPR